MVTRAVARVKTRVMVKVALDPPGGEKGRDGA